MNCWLHYVGTGYYTIQSFCNEASVWGINRRIAFPLLGGLCWQDRILVAQGEMKTHKRVVPAKGALAFGYFDVDGLAFDFPVIEMLKQKHVDLRFSKPNATEIIRKDGTYAISNRTEIQLPISDIATLVRENLCSARKPKAFLQGSLRTFEQPIRLSDYTFRKGYQRIDEVLFSVLPHISPTEKEIVVSGRFPTARDMLAEEPIHGYVAEIRNFQQHKRSYTGRYNYSFKGAEHAENRAAN